MWNMHTPFLNTILKARGSCIRMFTLLPQESERSRAEVGIPPLYTVWMTSARETHNPEAQSIA